MDTRVSEISVRTWWHGGWVNGIKLVAGIILLCLPSYSASYFRRDESGYKIPSRPLCVTETVMYTVGTQQEIRAESGATGRTKIARQQGNNQKCSQQQQQHHDTPGKPESAHLHAKVLLWRSPTKTNKKLSPSPHLYVLVCHLERFSVSP